MREAGSPRRPSGAGGSASHRGVHGLLRNKTRPPRIPLLDPSVAERVVVLTLNDSPGETTHWTATTMAAQTAISVSSVRRIWCAHGLAPHRIRQFKFSNDPELVARRATWSSSTSTRRRTSTLLSVDDPPSQSPLWRAKEGKSQIPALDRTQPGLPLRKGRASTMTLEYKRYGTTTRSPPSETRPAIRRITAAGARPDVEHAAPALSAASVIRATR